MCNQAATLGDRHNSAAAADAATMDTTHAAVVRETGYTAIDDTLVADANNGTAATDATRGAAWHAARTVANEYNDGATTAVWPADPMRVYPMTGRGKFYQE